MKKVLKSRIFIVIICGIIFTSLGVYAGAEYNYKASEISYNSSNGDSMTVNEALNELYNNKINDIIYSNISSSTELFSFSGTTSSGTSSTYITKSYTYTGEDVNNEYKYLIFSLSHGSAANLMYMGISEISVIGNKFIDTFVQGNSSQVSTGNILYIINASELKQDELIFSIKFRGLFIIKLIGVK